MEAGNVEVIVDRARCVSLGMCEAASEAFELDDDGELVVHEDRVRTAPAQELREAVESCPVRALSLKPAE